ncbi:Uncharacterised protein [Mycobacterium tuberculosis]|nr:Uncharacterised protein [Mycobacterium tuberculosis]
MLTSNEEVTYVKGDFNDREKIISSNALLIFEQLRDQ